VRDRDTSVVNGLSDVVDATAGCAVDVPQEMAHRGDHKDDEGGDDK